MGNKLFGTDGVRGVANKYPMTAECAFRLAKVLSYLLCKSKKRVAMAKDTRVSGDMLESAMIAGFTSMGIDVVCLGVVPTPLLTATTKSLNVDAAVMITASHNPYHDNGIKVINGNGDKFDDAQTAEIEKLLLSDMEFTVSTEEIGRVIHEHSVIENYIKTACAMVSNDDALKGLRVVLDCANGAFSEIMPQVFKSLGAGVITLANKPDGYNINHDCGSQHTKIMQQTVVDSHAHIGIAVDGDGDRIIICDENGKRIDGDQIIAYLATYLKHNKLLKANAAVATIWSNMGLEKYLNSLGIDFYRTAVGERYVIEKMREVGSNVGGEESGHMVLSDYARTGDALLTGLVISLGLLQSGKKMSEIFPLFINCPCKISSVCFSAMDKAASALAQQSVQTAIMAAKNEIEGKGSVIVRKSGTEPVVKIRVEAEDEKLVNDLSSVLVKEVEKYL